MPERYIAVDNVCAWPNLTLLPDGAIIATIFNQPTHGGWEGDVECWASTDDGRTWQLRGVPAPHDPGTNRMNVAAGCGHDGTLIVLASGWSKRNAVGDYSSPHEGEVLTTWACRSEDGGQSWERAETMRQPPGKCARSIPFGDIIQLSGGVLGACIYGSSVEGDSSAWFYTSADDGRTWEARGPMREGNTTETTPLALPDGRLLAAARTQGDQHLDLFASDDDGATWSCEGPVTLGRQHPGHLLRLRDGRLLLTYGIRNQGLHGVGVRFSTDDGASWEPPRVLVDYEYTVDGGYPASVETEDGTIVTAYYAGRVPSHHRYHMGVIRWQAEES